MKVFSKVLLMVVVLLMVAAPMIIKGPSGKPIMDVRDWLPGVDRAIGLARELIQQSEVAVKEPLEPLKEQVSDVVEPANNDIDVAKAPVKLAANSGKMYKWQDEQGHWHFSTEKPINQKQLTLENLPKVENVMDAPVEADSNGSMMSLPGMGNVGDMLEKVQRMAAERDQ